MRSNLFSNPRRTRPPQGGEVGPAPHIFGGQGHLKVARWSPPLIFSMDKATSRWRGGPRRHQLHGFPQLHGWSGFSRHQVSSRWRGKGSHCRNWPICQINSQPTPIGQFFSPFGLLGQFCPKSNSN
ncbi:hypothetical protein V6N12_040661 [Hibiscus sabdariffa]|uniref:Uncharacterized protein n=1 Tax=Hibiscus sabdariffa TaxID=183260 RepID=A0ABR2E4E8_9ROSI